MRLRRNLGLVLLGIGAPVACSHSAALNGEGSIPLPNGAGGVAAGSGGSGSLPPELELEDNFKAPVVARTFLFTANPSSNRVALINGDSLEVASLEAGHEPTYLAALPETDQGDGALVLNVLSQDASLYHLPKDGGLKDVTSLRVPVHPGANAWAVGTTGKFAIAWTQAGATQTSEGFQDITILEPGEVPVATRIGVGFRPSAVHISSDEKRAVIVSDPGLTIVELGANGTSGVIAEYPLPAITSGSRDVSVTPDGSVALVRLENESTLLSMRLDTGATTRTELPGALTDLDLSADGGLAVGVIRAASEPPMGQGGQGGMGGAAGSAGAAPGGAAGSGPTSEMPNQSWVVVLQDPNKLSKAPAPVLIPIADVVGSVSLTANGSTALLYSNAAASSHIWILDIKTRQLRLNDVRSPVQAVLPAPDGQHAVAMLLPPPGSARLGAFALLPLSQDLPARILGTPAPTAQVAFSPDGEAVLITTRASGAASSFAYVGAFPGLSVDEVPLPSPPLAAGVLGPLHKGFIAEEHPEGRITFVGLHDSTVTTLTGYELGSRVVE